MNTIKRALPTALLAFRGHVVSAKLTSEFLGFGIVNMIPATVFCRYASICRVLPVILLCFSFHVQAEIVWSGDFDDGTLKKWHVANDPNIVFINGVPQYGRPIQYGGQSQGHVGDGSLMALVAATQHSRNGVTYQQGPTRGSPYTMRTTVLNSANGGDAERNWDVPGGTSGAGRRRSEIWGFGQQWSYYGEMPYLSERWMSVSIFVPADWDSVSGSGWGVTVWQFKANTSGGISPTFAVSLKNWGWQIEHRWSDVRHPNTSDAVPWQFQMYYDSNYPSSSSWPDGLNAFPNVQESRAALGRINKGAWTDFVAHVRWDSRGSDRGGTGFLDLYMRAGSGPWVQVLNVTPGQTTRGGMTFNHGVGYDFSGSGAGGNMGMYMDNDQVLPLSANRVIYHSNFKIGDENTAFSEMSHDGSAPDTSAIVAPNAPEQLRAN